MVLMQIMILTLNFNHDGIGDICGVIGGGAGVGTTVCGILSSRYVECGRSIALCEGEGPCTRNIGRHGLNRVSLCEGSGAATK